MKISKTQEKAKRGTHLYFSDLTESMKLDLVIHLKQNKMTELLQAIEKEDNVVVGIIFNAEDMEVAR